MTDVVTRAGGPDKDLGEDILASDSPAGLRSRAATLVEQTRADDGGPWGDEQTEHVTKMLDGDRRGLIAAHLLATGGDAYRSAFERVLRDPARGHLEFDDEETEAWRRGAQYSRDAHRTALSLTDANRGLMVPYTIDPTILLQNDSTVNPLRSVRRVVQTTTDSWNAINSDGTDAEFAAEAAQVADQSPTVSEPTIIPERAHSWIFGSFEVLEDANFAWQINKLVSDAKDWLEGTKFTLGAGHGSKEPHGIVPAIVAADDAGSHIKASASADTFAAADIYALQEFVPPRGRSGSPMFMAALPIINLCRQFETTGGALKFPEAANGRLARWRLIENSNVDGTYGSGENNVMVAGDPSGFVIVDRVGMRVLYEPLVKGGNARPTGQAGYYAFWRTSSGLVEPSKLRVLNVT